MFRKLYNQAVLEGSIEPDDPILIVQGGATLDPVAPDLSFVRTLRDGEPTVYLPGSSLKGVLRAQAERILATEIAEAAAEDPFDTGAERRGRANKKRDAGDTAGVYQSSCEADRLFGSTEIAGRFRIGDALPPRRKDDIEGFETANRTEIRYGVAIHRAKQSVKHGPFEQETVTSGRFVFKAVLENFELWMLSLLLQALKDLHLGMVQIGHAKSRGLGSVRVVKPQLVIRWPGSAPSRLEGAGAREPDPEMRRKYGLDAEDSVDLPAHRVLEDVSMFSGYRFQGWTGLDAVLGEVAGIPWKRFVIRAKKEAGDAQ